MTRVSLLICILTASCCSALGQNGQFKTYDQFDPTPRGDARFRVGFWNMENFFDLKNDSLKRDDEFTPKGANKYTFKRYNHKKNGLARTIVAMGGWEPIALMGVSEVESRWVLDGLTEFSPLKAITYQVIHQDSPDRRGIDIACIYRPDKFNLINYKYFRINFPNDPERKTRDMLYVKGRMPNGDTLHFFVNHWPSRWGGQFTSEPSRVYVAGVLRQKIDSLQARFHNPYIVVTGDFNDEPDDLSIAEHLHAHPPGDPRMPGELVNLMYPVKHVYGTHSFAGQWGVLDQFIVTANLLDGGSITTSTGEVGIFNPPWMLKKNAAGDDVTNRTYQGPAYKGGYSDHLPIYLDLNLRGKHKKGGTATVPPQ